MVIKIQTELLRWINFCRVCSVELYSQERISLYLRPRQNRFTYIKCKNFFFLFMERKA